MTTIIREANHVYSDSRYGKHNGSMRSVLNDGPPKLALHKSRKCVVAFAGSVPSDLVVYHALDEVIERIIREGVKYPDVNIYTWGDPFDAVAAKLDKEENAIAEVSIMFFFKKFTFLLRYPGSGPVALCQLYSADDYICIGSGTMVYTGVRVTKLSIEEKFRAIYRGDTNSGGTVYRVDLNTLEDL